MNNWTWSRELDGTEQEHAPPHPALIVGCLFFAIFSAVIDAHMIHRFRGAWAAESWPSARGVIMRSSWTERPGLGVAEAEIRYQYIVDERLYQAEQVEYGDGGRIRQSQQQATLDRYPLESQVQVYYDPNDPAVACLQPGVGFVDYVTVVAPLIFSILQFFATIELYRMYTDERPAISYCGY